jgi:hypothetical protein
VFAFAMADILKLLDDHTSIGEMEGRIVIDLDGVFITEQRDLSIKVV